MAVDLTAGFIGWYKTFHSDWTAIAAVCTLMLSVVVVAFGDCVDWILVRNW